ncbi:MAG: PfkB family carbohydrate kinase [Syntrophales bacterium]|nr:PfkB family carbohydrate kinase [Syntrophales bacterium]
MRGYTVPRSRAIGLVDRFTCASVFVVGDLMVDHFIWGKVTRISPEAPVPVVEVESDRLLLGGGANVMNNIYALGGQVYGAGVVGDDEMGRYIINELRMRNVDTNGVVIEPNRKTTIKTRIIAHNQQVVRFDRESRKPIDVQSEEHILGVLETLRDRIGAIVVSDYGKGVVTETLMKGIRELVKGSGIVVCVDPKKNNYSIYRGADVVTPNNHEAERVVGYEIRDRSTLLRAGNEILTTYDLRAVLITRGEEGMSLFEKGSDTIHTEFPANAREVFDVTGAGDTAIGVFAPCFGGRGQFQGGCVPG